MATARRKCPDNRDEELAADLSVYVSAYHRVVARGAFNWRMLQVVAETLDQILRRHFKEINECVAPEVFYGLGGSCVSCMYGELLSIHDLVEQEVVEVTTE